MARLFKRTDESNNKVRFTTRVGIPTEWSQKNNLKRKRKFENILFLTEKLQEIYQTVNDFEKDNEDHHNL